MNQPMVATASPRTRLKLIDCDIHPSPKRPGDFRAYLPARWQAHFDSYGSHFRSPVLQADPYPKMQPNLARRNFRPPSGGPPGSDLDFMREQLLDPLNIEIGVLQVTNPNGSNQRNLDYSAAIASAVNEWQLAEWTDREPRLRASLVVPAEDPDAAVAEIRRRAGNPAFVQVAMPQRSTEPIGRRRYWPIYAAAVEHGLPVSLHTGGQNGFPTNPSGGWCAFYAEVHQMHTLAAQSQITSFIMEGVFDAFPDLKLMMVEGGFSWAPALGWRLDRLWRKLGSEVPHVKRPPSETIRERIWFSSQPMEDYEPHSLLRDMLDWMGWNNLVYSSDYPHWDYDDPVYAFPIRFSEAERQKIFRDNALRFLRLG